LRRVGAIPDVSESSCVTAVRLTIHMLAVAGATNWRNIHCSTVGYSLKACMVRGNSCQLLRHQHAKFLVRGPLLLCVP
jgi:hypothetical protein